MNREMGRSENNWEARRSENNWEAKRSENNWKWEEVILRFNDKKWEDLRIIKKVIIAEKWEETEKKLQNLSFKFAEQFVT